MDGIDGVSCGYEEPVPQFEIGFVDSVQAFRVIDDGIERAMYYSALSRIRHLLLQLLSLHNIIFDS
jgi:hypothetical protein